MGAWICTPGPFSSDLFLCPFGVDPTLRLMTPPEHGGLCPYLFAVFLLGWLLDWPLEAHSPLWGFPISYLV